jgi:DNA-binding transcriptional LysR family regulator
MLLPTAIADYKRTLPGIDVRLIDTQTDQIVDKVRSGEADCGVGTFAEDESGLKRQMLIRDALMVFCNRRSPLSDARQVAWRALADHPLIAMTRDSSIRSLAERSFEAAGQTLRPAFEVSQMTTAVMLVEAGLGVAVLPTYVWSFARDHKVISKPLVEPHVSRDISMIHAAGRSLSPAAESFARFLRKHARLSLPRRVSGRVRQ